MTARRRGVARAVDRYVDAASSMRPRQLLARPRRLVPPRWLASGSGGSGWRPLAAGAGVEPAPQSGPQPPPHRDGRFRAVGREREFPRRGFWDDRADGLLFLFHLHGFADLARYAAAPAEPEGDAFWARVLESWLAEAGRPARPAWHPFPTSGRIVAWAAALSRGGWPLDLERALLAGLRPQVRLLRRSVEQDIGGNHVLRNAAALAIGGACLEDRRAEARGLALLERELERQLLADGGHEERSPSYHRAVLADLRDVDAVLHAAGRGAPEWLERASRAMEAWLGAVAGPDGHLPMLNDGWEGPPVAAGGAARPPVDDLGASGYVALRSGADQALLDVGPVAPPHLPPHAHADVLSFVLWADGAPVVVDPGSYSYEGAERQRYRGTAAHNTVVVDGADQCDLWAPFRAAHMPRVRREPLRRAGDAVVVTAEHDGYRRLRDPVVHRRTFCWLPGAGLVVLDRLLAREAHAVDARIHLAHGVPFAGGRAGPLRVEPLGAGPAPAVVAGGYAPYLGTKQPIEVLSRAFHAPPGVLFGWALARDGVEVELAGDRLTVRSEGSALLELAVP